MLSLARRENETLHFYTSDGLIAVTDRVIKGNQVKLSIDASDIVNVIRSEIDVLHTDINNIVQVNLA
jgi:Carbon storage regulator (could also regulate swarming and quorum sensing)